MQEQVLMTAPLVVEDEVARREDRQEIVLLLHDFTFQSPEEGLANLTNANGHGTRAVVQRAGDSSGHGVGAQHAAVAGMDMHGMNMAGLDMTAMNIAGHGTA